MAEKMQCRNAIFGKALSNIASYLLGAVPGTAVELVSAGLLVGGKTFIRTAIGSALIVDGVINAACTVKKSIDIGNAASQAMDTYCGKVE